MRILSVKVVVLALMVFGVAAMGGGCCKSMALNPNTKSIDLSENSIAIMTVKVANVHVPGHQPRLDFAYVGPNPEKPREQVFSTQAPYIVEKKKFNEHLVSFSLPPGEYWLEGFYGSVQVPLLLSAGCMLPVEKSFILEPGEIVYLGCIDARIQKKGNGDKAAGPPLPLIDQAVAGFSTGTFDVDVIDNYNEDVQFFISEYPVLQGYTVEKSILE